MFNYVIHTYGPVRIGTTKEQRKVFFNIGKARRALGHMGLNSDDPKAIAKILGVLPAHVEEMMPRLGDYDLHLNANPQDGLKTRCASLTLADASPEEKLAEKEKDEQLSALIRKGMRSLDARERVILRDRHLTEDPATLDTLGKQFGVSRERVRQIEIRAMKKMKAAMAKKSPQIFAV